jgi:hypothetical protein
MHRRRNGGSNDSRKIKTIYESMQLFYYIVKSIHEPGISNSCMLLLMCTYLLILGDFRKLKMIFTTTYANIYASLCNLSTT